jgi:hypothetical protein
MVVHNLYTFSFIQQIDIVSFCLEQMQLVSLNRLLWFNNFLFEFFIIFISLDY